MANYRWKPIEDLPSNWEQMVSAELSAQYHAWLEAKTRLEGSEGLKHFNERLRREWAIETGIIEGLYSIDRGTTETLIEHGISTAYIAYGSSDRPAEDIVPILNAQLDALEGLFDFVAGRRDLTVSYVREIHAAITREQKTVRVYDREGNALEVPLLRGEWKQHPNNPLRLDNSVHEYCPPVHVASEMDRLIAMHNSHLNIPPEVQSAWLHHRFIQIHPFQDGNGRVARALSSIIAIRAGWFPLVIRRYDRPSYIDALEHADAGNLGPLVSFVSKLHTNSFIEAIVLSASLMRERIAIDSIVERHRSKGSQSPAEWEIVDDRSSVLQEITKERLLLTARDLQAKLATPGAPTDVAIELVKPDSDPLIKQRTMHWLEADQRLLDNSRQTATIRLKLTLNNRYELVFVFYSPGHPFTGVLKASAIVVMYENPEKSRKQKPYVFDITGGGISFSYDGDEVILLHNYQRWLNTAITQSLQKIVELI